MRGGQKASTNLGLVLHVFLNGVAEILWSRTWSEGSKEENREQIKIPVLNSVPFPMGYTGSLQCKGNICCAAFNGT